MNETEDKSLRDWRINTEYPKQAKEAYSDRSVTIDGQKWNVTFNIKYQYDKDFTPEKLVPGDNVLEIGKNVERSNVDVLNNTRGYVNEERSRNGSGTVGHETGHNIGFDDRYIDYKSDGQPFIDYLKEKYTSPEDNITGGKLWQLIDAARKMNPITVSVPTEGYENNEMSNKSGGLTDEQVVALVNAVKKQGGNSGVVHGIFDKRSDKPSAKRLAEVFAEFEKAIQDKIKESAPPPATPTSNK